MVTADELRDALSRHASPTIGRGFHSGQAGWIVYEPFIEFLAAALSAPTGRERVRHRKRGSTYTVMGRAKVQTGTPLTDYSEVVVYRSEADGSLWVRPVAEFEDGRFEAAHGGVDG